MKTVMLILAWTWVSLPLGWGVFKSVQKSAPLFVSETAAKP